MRSASRRSCAVRARHSTPQGGPRELEGDGWLLPLLERRVRALGAALIALGFYSSLIAGLVPQDAVSWEGHLFGLVAGVIASKALAEPRVVPEDRPYEPEPWELREPWNI